jgi:hypothetical protein
MIEFTLMLPILVSLFLGVAFFGFDFYQYNRLEESVRGASRFGSTQDYDSLNSLDPPLNCANCLVTLDPASSRLALRVQNFMLYGTPSPTGTEPLLIEGLTRANISVAVRVTNSFPVGVRVGITGYRMLTPTGAITLNNKPATEFPYLGRYATP